MAIQVSADGQAAVRCTYCHKPITRRQWIGFVGDSRQCSRFWCRVWSGHLMWMLFQRRFYWKSFQVSIPYPVFSKKGRER